MGCYRGVKCACSRRSPIPAGAGPGTPVIPGRSVQLRLHSPPRRCEGAADDNGDWGTIRQWIPWTFVGPGTDPGAAIEGRCASNARFRRTRRAGQALMPVMYEDERSIQNMRPSSQTIGPLCLTFGGMRSSSLVPVPRQLRARRLTDGPKSIFCTIALGRSLRVETRAKFGGGIPIARTVPRKPFPLLDLQSETWQ
jgi:hypothetical protein